MIRIYLITVIVYLSSSCLAFSQSRNGDNIDLESLGLDNVNKKESLALPTFSVQKKKEKIDNKELALPEIAIDENIKVEVKNKQKKNLETKKEPIIVPPKISKDETINQEQVIKKKVLKGPVIKTKSGNIIQAVKPSLIPTIEVKKEEPEEVVLTEEEQQAEKEEEKRLEELEILMQKYLINDQAIMSGEKVILPKRKEVNPFISEEIPAPPILDSYRTRDNNHIPSFLSLDKRIKNLFETISYGDVAFFNSAYQDVKNPNIRNELGDTLLTYSLLTQKHAIVASLISKGADVNIPNKLGYTPLDIVIELKDFQNFELLINNKANIYFTDKFGRTYLFHAARIGFLSAVKELVKRNIDINAIDKDGFSALDIAYKNKKELIVQYLLKNGAKTWIEKPFDPRNSSLIKKLESRWGETFNNSQY